MRSLSATQSAPEPRLGRQGFEDCCDGFAHLEVHLPCDAAPSPWRIVSSGETDCLLCGAVLSAECSATDNSGQDAMGTSGRDGTGR